MQVGVRELVPAVRHLVEYERSSLAAADTIAAAEGVVAADPDLLLHRIVAQFQHLFDCPRLQGVLPALNQVDDAPLLTTPNPQQCPHSLFFLDPAFARSSFCSNMHPLLLLWNRSMVFIHSWFH